MSRTTMSAAFAAILAASMPVAFAQTATTPTTTPPNATTGSAASGTSVGGTAATSNGATGSTAQTAAPARQPATEMMPGQVRFTEMDGATVYDAENNSVAEIEDVVLDRDGRVAAVVLGVGGFLGFGGKDVAVSVNDLRMTSTDAGTPRFQIDMTKDQLKSAQAFDLTAPSTATGTSTPPANSSGSTTR